MNTKIFRQYDGPWARKPYPTKGCTVSGAGCGLVACTHIAIEQESKKDWTPETLRPYMLKYAVAGQGTTWNGITKTLEHLGHKVKYITESTPMKDAFAELNKGNRIGIILFYGGYSKRKKKWYRTPDGTVWTGNGHYIMFADYKYENGRHWFYMKDSGGRKHDGWYSYELSMKGCVGQMWIVEKVGTQVTPKKATTPDGKLVVDGVGGVATVKAMERFFGTTQDGVISSQNKNLKQYYKSLTSVSFADKPKGSTVVKMMQKWLGIGIDGIWGKETSVALQKILGVNPDGKFGPTSMKAFQKFLNTHDSADRTPIEKSNTQKILDTAKALAWPAGTPASKYAWKGGSATSAFTAALNKIAPKRHWGPGPQKGASCDVFVFTVVNSTGIVTNYPRGLDEQIKYSNSAFQKLVYKNVTPYSVSKPGDIIMYYKKSDGSSKHTCIRGEGVIFEAQHEKTFGHVNLSVKKKLDVKRPYVVILRAK